MNMIKEKSDNGTGGELTAGMRWFLWSLVLIIPAVFLIMGLTTAMVGAKNISGVLQGVVGFLIGGYFFISLLRLAWRANSTGYVLKLGPKGIQHCLGLELAWIDVKGADMEWVKTDKFAEECVVLTLSPAGVESYRAIHNPFNSSFLKMTGEKLALIPLCIDAPLSTLCNIARYFISP